VRREGAQHFLAERFGGMIRPARMPDTNNNSPSVVVRDYPHMMRGPRYAWWRPLLAMPLAALFALIMMLGLFGILALAGQWELLDQAFKADNMVPVSFGLGNVVLGCLIPATMLATRIMHGVRPGFVSSVTGGFRWRWAMRCTLILVPLYILAFALDQLINGPKGTIPEQQAMLVLMVLIGTPFQAAGEEYLFRGLVMQNVGAWFRHPTVALVVTTALSTGLFAAAHGSGDVWVLLDLGVFALACCILIWRTGGIEAAVVLHAVNNMVGMIGTIFVGGWAEGFVDDTSVGKPQDLLLTVLITSVTVPLVLRAAKRYGIQRVYQPTEEVVGSRRMTAGLWTVLIAPLALLVLVFAGAVVLQLMRTSAPRLQHYADVARTAGTTLDGCTAGYRLDFLPMEIRHFDSRELVADDVSLHLGEVVITGSKGVFQFPVSPALMRINPEVHVVTPDGKSIRYHYKLTVVINSSSGIQRCPVPAP
jgi:membrane protease YdiL (CAAX protease family)